jgi:hypothetical protein
MVGSEEGPRYGTEYSLGWVLQVGLGVLVGGDNELMLSPDFLDSFFLRMFVPFPPFPPFPPSPHSTALFDSLGLSIRGRDLDKRRKH